MHAPIVSRQVSGYSVSQLTSNLKKLMQERDYHHKEALITSELHWSSYKRLHNTINTRMYKEKSDYYSNQLADEQ